MQYTNRVYLDFSPHNEWSAHYEKGDLRNGWYLALSKEFIDQFLPKFKSYKDVEDAFDVELVDTEDNNKIYRVAWWGGYQEESEESGWIFDSQWEHPQIYTINQYFYEDKFCSHNRKGEAVRAGAIEKSELDEDQEWERFKIKSVTCKEFPDLILYSETLDWEQLEELLLQ